MLTIDSSGALTEVPPFHAAALDLFRTLKARNFFMRPPPEGLPQSGAVAFVVMEGWFDGAYGRSPDEAVLRLIERVVNDKVDCHRCERAVWVDSVDVTSPLDPAARDYLDSEKEKTLSTCTLYFDHRVVQWKLSCQGFDPDIEPTEGGEEWKSAPAAKLIVP